MAWRKTTTFSPLISKWNVATRHQEMNCVTRICPEGPQMLIRPQGRKYSSPSRKFFCTQSRVGASTTMQQIFQRFSPLNLHSPSGAKQPSDSSNWNRSWNRLNGMPIRTMSTRISRFARIALGRTSCARNSSDSLNTSDWFGRGWTKPRPRSTHLPPWSPQAE